jgi:hypothetical protein
LSRSRIPCLGKKNFFAEWRCQQTQYRVIQKLYTYICRQVGFVSAHSLRIKLVWLRSFVDVQISERQNVDITN